ncbi:MAG: Ig-like domain-containing protein [Paludibacteraceae bacterium]|nr:Ig-like domain-containing protein [Paludibacteraceae bacterium]
MKANKFFAIALAALTMVGFNSCKDKEKEVEALTLTPTSLTLKVGETGTITANITVETWASNNEAVATVDKGVVTAVAEGNAIISATANGTTKTCVVLVEKAGQQGGDEKTIEAKRIWPVILDGVTSEKYASLIAGDFRVNDVDNFLYIWAAGETYNAGDGTGKNFFGNTEGYMALTVAAPAGWSGGGFCITNTESVAAAQVLKEAVTANPDKYFLHIAIKAANDGTHQFSVFDDAAFFNIGTEKIDGKGNIIGNFERDGEWHEFDVPLSAYTTEIAGSIVKSGMNIFSIRSGATVGAQLNLDAVYFYEKE